MASKKKPTSIGFSCGDPNGIGIETLIKVFSDDRMFQEATPVLYATPNLVEAASECTKHTDIAWKVIASADEAKEGQLNLVCIQDEPWEIKWGEVDGKAGEFAMKSLQAVVNDLASTKGVWVRFPLPRNVESCAVVRTGSNDGQACSEVHSVAKTEGFEWG